MKTYLAAAACAAICSFPAYAQDPSSVLDIGFDGEADLFLDRQVFGLDMTGEAHDDEIVVPEGYREAPDSPFDGQSVYFADGARTLGTVETVYEDEAGARRIVVTLADGVDVAMADAIYVALPADANAAEAIRLDMTEAQLARIAANWAD